MITYYLKSFLQKCRYKIERPEDLGHVSWIELFVYTLRQAQHEYKKTFTRYLDTYTILDADTASIDTPYGKVFLPPSLGIVSLGYLIKEAFDKTHWHHYETSLTPVKPDDVVVDIGSSIGLWSLSIVEKVKRVHLVEPQGEFVRALEKTFARYIDDHRVVIRQGAVSSADGKCKVIRDQPGDVMATIRPDPTGDIDLCRLDTLFAEEAVNFIKVDIEGVEMDLLHGAMEIIRRDRPRIAITVYHEQNDWREMRDFILSLVPAYRWQLKGMMSSGKPLMLHMNADE